MTDTLAAELERLTSNATLRREDLLLTALRKAARRKALTIGAGVLALTSAGTITTVVAKVFGSTSVQLLAALTAAVSGTGSLLIAAYYGDDVVLTMLSGSAKYLALRENVYRLVVHPNISDPERFKRLAELQNEYARLDETFSRYFSIRRARSSQRPPHWEASQRAQAAVVEERDKLRRELQKTESAP